MDDLQAFGRKLLLSVLGAREGESGRGHRAAAGASPADLSRISETDAEAARGGRRGLIGPDGLAGPLEFGEPPGESFPPDDSSETL